LLSDLTILIPTYNRQRLLEYSIEYWRDLSATIHIIDGSEQPCFEIGPLTGTKNIFYHHMPNSIGFDPFINFTNRLRFGALLPKTKFVACLGEDDFYTQSGLIKSLKYLESHEEVDAVAGRTLVFQQANNRILWNATLFSQKDSEASRSQFVGDRVNSGQTWDLYAICRSEIFSNFLRVSYETKSFTCDEPTTHEWMMLIFCRALFRTKFIETVLMIRRSIGEKLLKKLTLRTITLNDQMHELWGKTFFDFMKLPEFQKYVREIEDQLVAGFNIVSEDSELNLRIVQKIVSDQISSRDKPSAENTKRLKVKKYFRELIIKISPNFFKDFCLQLIPIDKAIRLKQCDLKLMKRLLRRWDVEFNNEELTGIEKLLLKPREELRLRANI